MSSNPSSDKASSVAGIRPPPDARNGPAAVDAPALRSYIGGMCHLICRKSMTRMAFLLAVALPMWAGDAIAEDYSLGTIEIAAPWTRPTPNGAHIAPPHPPPPNKHTPPTPLT